jgi:hypothetical protein
VTCIVGLVDGPRSWIGGDACISGDGLKWATGPKVWQAGAFLAGFAGGSEYCHLLQLRIKWPASCPADLDRYMRVELPDYLRETCRRAGLDSPDGAALIVAPGSLWAFDDFTCERAHEGYAAVGSGSAVALGALAATAGRSGGARVRLALDAAARHCTDVGGPFTILRG